MSVETSRTNPPGDGDSDDEQTFGYRSADSAAAVDDDLDDDDELDDDTVASVDDDDEDDDATVVQGSVYDSSAVDYGTTDSGVTDYGIADPNAPLLGDSVSLRANWQQAQAGFVDDPRAAVADAAELVEHAAQTLIGSLQQRQRALRTQWDNNGSGEAGAATSGDLSDTEQLRHLMQDYRNLFNQLVQQ